MTEEAVLYCANHPNRETLLRCNKCGKPICMKCATLTDVGYRCRGCIRSQQSVYFNAESWDNPIAFAVSFLVTLIATPFVSIIFGISGFFGWIFAFIMGPGAGGIFSQIIRKAVGRRRGRYLSLFAMGGVILGLLLGIFIGSIFGLRTFSLPLIVFAFLASTTAYQVLR